MCMKKRWLAGLPHDTSVQKATSDNENVDAFQRHAQDGTVQLVCWRPNKNINITLLIQPFFYTQCIAYPTLYMN